MDFLVEQIGDVTFVLMPDSFLDASNIEQFKTKMAPVIAAHRNLVFDMSQLEFVDSAGFSAILSTLKRVQAKGGDLKLCNLTRSVRMVLELIQFHKIVEIYESREAASAAFVP